MAAPATYSHTHLGFGDGGNRPKAVLLSYLLFQKACCRDLIEFVYKDAMARRENLTSVLGA